MTVVNLREEPEYLEQAIAYIQSKWGNRRNKKVYADCITKSIDAKSPLPVWYVLMDSDNIIGCGSLITDEFISRMDLCACLSAPYMENKHRGQN